MSPKNENIGDLLAEARAIYKAMQFNQITYEEAKKKTAPLLQRINIRLEAIAKSHGMKPKLISFYSLGSNF